MDIGIHIYLGQLDIEHTNFLTLIDKRGTALADIHRGEHFAALNSVFLTAVTADDPRLVVVLDIICVPRNAIEFRLPIIIDSL